MMLPRRRGSVPAWVLSLLGLISSCQFLCINLYLQIRRFKLRRTEGETGSIKEAPSSPPRRTESDPAALGRTHAVMRNRRDVADRGHGEAHCLERPQSGFPAR